MPGCLDTARRIPDHERTAALSHHRPVHHPSIPRTPLRRMLLHPRHHVVAPGDSVALARATRIDCAPFLTGCLHRLRRCKHAGMVVHTVGHPSDHVLTPVRRRYWSRAASLPLGACLLKFRKLLRTHLITRATAEDHTAHHPTDNQHGHERDDPRRPALSGNRLYCLGRWGFVTCAHLPNVRFRSTRPLGPEVPSGGEDRPIETLGTGAPLFRPVIALRTVAVCSHPSADRATGLPGATDR
jgi:hypothetical protein